MKRGYKCMHRWREQPYFVCIVKRKLQRNEIVTACASSVCTTLYNARGFIESRPEDFVVQGLYVWEDKRQDNERKKEKDKKT